GTAAAAATDLVLPAAERAASRHGGRSSQSPPVAGRSRQRLAPSPHLPRATSWPRPPGLTTQLMTTAGAGNPLHRSDLLRLAQRDPPPRLIRPAGPQSTSSIFTAGHRLIKRPFDETSPNSNARAGLGG